MRPEGPGEAARMEQHLPPAKSAQLQPSLADVCPTCSQKPSAAMTPHPRLAFLSSPPLFPLRSPVSPRHPSLRLSVVLLLIARGCGE